MNHNEEVERRLLVLEGPEKLDTPYSLKDFTPAIILGLAIPLVLIIIGWGA